ncbi:amidase domain-containing protein [Bacillus sp. FJAT-27225]|uniref:amidase domain-containing protein n=1 Tax=Bacillus sp. FJAT-27225 TaxID=1743144 RepID=UPI001111AD71|nr:amidase domain-containing protein [Bacillus sp. FJAT-27225]
MLGQLRELLQQRVKDFVNGLDEGTDEKARRKKQACLDRGAEIVKTHGRGMIVHQSRDSSEERVLYEVHFQNLIKQGSKIYLEEEVETREAVFIEGILSSDSEVVPVQPGAALSTDLVLEALRGAGERISYTYDRWKAVQYAERWWNSYNPAFKKFEVDCTNFISQCLYAGGAPMRGYPNKGQGWWIRNNNWSYSWTVANSLRWYLASSKSGLRAREVSSANQLLPGDVICYDFEGDGRFNHNTIVVAKDANGMPLVNAHTYNSRMRYWEYTDSSAYTPNIKYKFYTIIDDSRRWL